MKIALFGLTGIKTGKHNLKDPRFDETHKLVEADKQTRAQVDVVGDDELLDADAILVSVEGRANMILKDLEFVETRAQVDVVGDDELLDADAILVSVEGRANMILKDLEFVETRAQVDVVGDDEL